MRVTLERNYLMRLLNMCQPLGKDLNLIIGEDNKKPILDSELMHDEANIGQNFTKKKQRHI